MRHDYLTNTPLAEARTAFLAAALSAGFLAGSETVPVAESAGRITAEAVWARISAPHYNASAMDGIAVRSERTFGARSAEGARRAGASASRRRSQSRISRS